MLAIGYPTNTALHLDRPNALNPRESVSSPHPSLHLLIRLSLASPSLPNSASTSGHYHQEEQQGTTAQYLSSRRRSTTSATARAHATTLRRSPANSRHRTGVIGFVRGRRIDRSHRGSP